VLFSITLFPLAVVACSGKENELRVWLEHFPLSIAMIRFTVSDFNRLGSPMGFRYCLPEYTGPKQDMEQLSIAQGKVQDYELRPGMKMVLSDIITHHQYAATSLAAPQFSAIVIVRGRAHAQLAKQSSLSMTAQRGATIAHADALTVTGTHPAGQRLRGLNITMSTPDSLADSPLGEALAGVMASTQIWLQPWAVPPHLLTAIDQLIDSPLQGALHHLLLEGISLQVLAHALDGLARSTEKNSPVSIRDRQLLERVKECLYQAPGEDHTLAELARLACMSPSTLRLKFQAVYGCSVFSWLRERRLELAREYLMQGGSVQQAAHSVGYRHATNFATAFRERYGISPSELSQA
jgi:AraC-like DNA-binding protein